MVAVRIPLRGCRCAGLTARELHVLTLAAQGLSDKEIADRLVISVKTVGSHLANIAEFYDSPNGGRRTTRSIVSALKRGDLHLEDL